MGRYRVTERTAAPMLPAPRVTQQMRARAGDAATKGAAAESVLIRQGAWTTVAKVVSEARTLSATLANDATLYFAVSAQKTYRVRGCIRISAGIVPDLQWTFATPELLFAAAEYEYQAIGVARTTVLASSLPGTITESGVGVDQAGFISFNFVITVKFAGTFAFQWSQSVSSAVATTCHLGSYIEYAVIA